MASFKGKLIGFLLLKSLLSPLASFLYFPRLKHGPMFRWFGGLYGNNSVVNMCRIEGKYL